jgi:hypothetical protein
MAAWKDALRAVQKEELKETWWESGKVCSEVA